MTHYLAQWVRDANAADPAMRRAYAWLLSSGAALMIFATAILGSLVATRWGEMPQAVAWLSAALLVTMPVLSALFLVMTARGRLWRSIACDHPVTMVIRAGKIANVEQCTACGHTMDRWRPAGPVRRS